MDITRLIERLPTEIKLCTVDFTDVRTTKGSATRIMLDRLLNDEEMESLRKVRGVFGINEYVVI